MKIAFECPDCGQVYEVDGALGGRKARCKECGIVVVVPVPAAEGEDCEAYPLDDPAPAAGAPGPSTYVRVPADPGLRPSVRWGEEPVGLIKQAKEDAAAVAAHVAALWPWLFGVPAGAAVVLGVVAAAVPGGTMIAGDILALVGIAMMLGGHAVGAYVAFTEDSLHGWMYLLIPIFTAYYVVANWDDLWRWVVLSGAGVVVLAVAGLVMRAGLEKAAPVVEGPAEEARVARPAGAIRLAWAAPLDPTARS